MRSYQLHLFSLDTKCIIAYIRENTEKEAGVSYALGKCQIAPMWQLSIPRRDLEAALYSTRLRAQILKEHDIIFDEIHHWTDSVTVLHWLQSPHKRQITL